MTDASKAHSAAAGDVFSRAPFSKGGLMLADGTFFEGTGFGAVGSAIGEVCFNTAMTGYQEILSDPSYAGQIVAFGAMVERAAAKLPEIEVSMGGLEWGTMRMDPLHVRKVG